MDLNKAAYWPRKAAKEGVVEAQCPLAVQCHDGFGSPKDPDKAARLFALAA